MENLLQPEYLSHRDTAIRQMVLCIKVQRFENRAKSTNAPIAIQLALLLL